MKKEKEIPLKNYILLSIVLILTIVVVIYFFLWKNTYEKSKLQTPILDDYLLVINYNELNNYLDVYKRQIYSYVESNPVNWNIVVTGGTERKIDFLSSGERNGKSPNRL